MVSAIEKLHLKEEMKEHLRDELQMRTSSIVVQNMSSAFILSNYELIKRIWPELSREIVTVAPPQIRFRDAPRINGTSHLQPRKKKLTLDLFEECSDNYEDIVSPLLREPSTARREGPKLDVSEIPLFCDEIITPVVKEKIKENPFILKEQEPKKEEIEVHLLKKVGNPQKETAGLQLGAEEGLIGWIKGDAE